MYDDPKKSLTIFLVDDDQLSIKIQEDALKKKFGSKTTIRTFETGEDCLAAVASSEPHLVILDYHLDSKKAEAANGLEILKRIQKHHPEVEVVMLSGQNKIDVAIETMRLGAKDYVVKGETSSLHIGQIISNIFAGAKQAHELKSYKMGFWLAVGVLGSIILGVLILYIFFPEHTKHLPL